MFQTVDWTKPDLGGLLSQVIVKEERQLNAPKPRVEVKHLWNPEDLKDRKTYWKENPRKKRMETGTLKSLGNPRSEHERYSRSTMLHERRADETLQAFYRQKKGEDGLQMHDRRRPMPPSTMANVTPELYEQMKPTYGANDKYATETSAALIGLGARSAPHSVPYFSRSVVTPSLAMESRNDQQRCQVEVGNLERRTMSRPATATSYTQRLNTRIQQQEIERRTNLFARSTHSAFCPRPHEIPFVDPRGR